jgi:hypothetical protein
MSHKVLPSLLLFKVIVKIKIIVVSLGKLSEIFVQHARENEHDKPDKEKHEDRRVDHRQPVDLEGLGEERVVHSVTFAEWDLRRMVVVVVVCA